MCCGKRGWPAPCVVPIPTITCDGIDGSPTSYQYDDFSSDRGWWDFTAGGAAFYTKVQGGQLVPNTPNGANNPFARNLILSGSPLVLGQVVTLEAVFSCLIGDPAILTGTGCDVYLGASAGGSPKAYIGPYLGSVQFVVTLSGAYPPSTALFASALPVVIGNNYTFRIKIERTSTQWNFYLDGVLQYSHVAAYANALISSNLHVCDRTLSGTHTRMVCDDFVVYGYNLPVDC